MKKGFALFISVLIALVGAAAQAQTEAEAQTTPQRPTELPPLPAEDAALASENYQRYCALCHGQDRTGYANDNAPSLTSKSLYAMGYLPIFRATAYGRTGTPMGPYVDDLGGPMSKGDIANLTRWLSEQAGVPPPLPDLEAFAIIPGNAVLGETIYHRECASCHGADGEGGGEHQPGTALGNSSMLAMTPDQFLRIAIAEGREGTPMRAYKDQLTEEEINGVVAFLRSRAEGWDIPASPPSAPPTPERYVLNPDGEAPAFTLSEGRYIDSEQLDKALKQKNRMILLDTRLPYLWATGHIRGAIPIPYYSEFDEIVENLPDKDTWIVAYCECPRAASNSVVNNLRERGYNNTAVIWEGYGGWVAKGYPSALGAVETN